MEVATARPSVDQRLWVREARKLRLPRWDFAAPVNIM
jgi:hypothetical protein